jgi:adenosylcobyric acid synthase
VVAQGFGLLANAKGLPVQGYEIHMGRTTGGRSAAPFSITGRSDVPVAEGAAFDGALDASGTVLGTYIHGLFHNGRLRSVILQALARRKGVTLGTSGLDLSLDQEFDKLADWVRGSLKMPLVYQMAGLTPDFYSASPSR